MMSSHRTMAAQGEPLLEWTVSHDAVNRHVTGTLTSKAMLRQSSEVSPWFYVLALLCLVSLLAFLYLALANYVACEMDKTATLEAEIQKTKDANNKLRLEIVLKEDLVRIQQEAKQMGFVEPQRVEYLKVVLDEPASPASSGQQSSGTGASSTPGWWDNMVRQFRDWVASVTEAEPRDSP
jgi:hypothetical protein